MKTYLFDFDGTLVDSMPTYAALMLRILREAEIDYPDNIIKIITPLGFIGTAEYFIGMGMKGERDEIVAKMREYATDAYTNDVPAKAHVIETVKFLKTRGDSLNVLTASPHTSLDPCLKRLGIYDLFDNVWSCEDFGTTKADPRIYEMAAERMGKCVRDVYFLDDNLNAVTTSMKANMKTIGVYDDSSAEYTAEIKAVCDAYINDFSELAEIDI